MKQHTVHIAVAAALFGTIVWLSVSLREQFQVNVDIPLAVESIPDGYAVSTPVPQSVRVKLHGDGWKLAAMLLGSDRNLTLAIPMTASRRHVVLLKEISDRITLRPGVQIVDVTPDTLNLELDRSIQKRVPVEPDCMLSFGSMYGQVGPISVSPDSVTIEGAQSVLRGIGIWKTEQRRFAGLQAPLDADVPLDRSSVYHLTVTPSYAHIHVDIERFAEKTLPGVPVEVRSVPADRQVILIPPRIELLVRAGIQQLSGLSDADIHVIADYSSVIADTTGTIEPVISVPQGVQVLQRHPERLTYIIRKAP